MRKNVNKQILFSGKISLRRRGGWGGMAPPVYTLILECLRFVQLKLTLFVVQPQNDSKF